MSLILKRMMGNAGLMEEADDGTGKGGGGGGNQDAEAAAAKAAADKAAAEKAAAEKLAAERREGNTGPTDAEAKLLKENMKKKEQLEAANKALEDFKKQYEGIDPEAVRKLLNDQKEAEKKELERKGDFDRLKAVMAEEHAKEKKALEDKIAALTGDLGRKDTVVKELSLGQQFSQSKFIAEELSLPAAKARALYADHFDVEDGKVVPYDKPRGAANRTPLVDAQGNHIDFEAALRKIVDADPDKDSLLKSKVRQGAASGSTRPVHLPGSKNEPAETTGLAKIAAGLKTLGVTR